MRPCLYLTRDLYPEAMYADGSTEDVKVWIDLPEKAGPDHFVMKDDVDAPLVFWTSSVPINDEPFTVTPEECLRRFGVVPGCGCMATIQLKHAENPTTPEVAAKRYRKAITKAIVTFHLGEDGPGMSLTQRASAVIDILKGALKT